MKKRKQVTKLTPQPQRSVAAERTKSSHLLPKHKEEQQSNRLLYASCIMFLLGAGTLALLYYVQYHSVRNAESTHPALGSLDAGKKFALSPCDRFFHNHTYRGATDLASQEITTYLFGEIHGLDEVHVSDCMEFLGAQTGDHFLIESPHEGAEVPCDSITPVYKRFNGKLKCFGIDVPINEARRLYGDSMFQIDFLKNKLPRIVEGSATVQEGMKKWIDFVDYIMSQSANLSQNSPASRLGIQDDDFYHRNGKYLKKLAKKMSGLSKREVSAFLFEELEKLSNKAEYYYSLSRGGPTNHAVVEHVMAHQKLLRSNQLRKQGAYQPRLFAAVGAAHLDASNNQEIKRIYEEGDSVMILSSKNYK